MLKRKADTLALARQTVARQALATTALLCTAGGACLPTMAQEASESFSLPVASENPGAECAVADLPPAAELPAIDGLPDPFTTLDGTPVTDKSQWWCRRQEILQQASAYLYGEKPPRPDNVSGTVTDENITVDVEHNANSISFEVVLSLPEGEGPFPAMIGYGGGFFGSGIPGPMQEVLTEQGIATIQYNPYDLGTENGGPSSAGAGRFYDLYGSDHSAGILVAWGYGVSRIIDVLEQDPEQRIDTAHIGVTGCSRFGKGPFVASAYDARIALTIPVESGIGGVPSVKMVPVTDPGGEQPQHALNYQKWFSPSAFAYFTDNLAQLPIDTHQTIGMIAPRGLLVIDNPPPGGIGNLDPRAAWGATVAGKAIYDALDAGNNIGYIGAGGPHCQWRPEYTAPMTAAVMRFLKGDATAELGTVETNGETVDMDDWINWTTPQLSGELQ